MLPFGQNQSNVRGRENTVNVVHNGEHPGAQDSVEKVEGQMEKVTHFPNPRVGQQKQLWGYFIQDQDKSEANKVPRMQNLRRCSVSDQAKVQHFPDLERGVA